MRVLAAGLFPATRQKSPPYTRGVFASRKLHLGHCTCGYSHLLHIATTDLALGKVSWQAMAADQATVGGFHVVRLEIPATTPQSRHLIDRGDLSPLSSSSSNRAGVFSASLRQPV
jgi:hypothetical protein